jgi:hypothetical protein
MTAREIIEKYGCARSTKGTPQNYVRLIVEGEAIVPPMTTVAAAVGAAGYRSGSFSDTPRTPMIAKWYASALQNKTQGTN